MRDVRTGRTPHLRIAERTQEMAKAPSTQECCWATTPGQHHPSCKNYTVRTVAHDGVKYAEHYCEARTWSQSRSGTWAGSHASNGCQRAAKGRTPDGHWACGLHLKNAPANGWN